MSEPPKKGCLFALQQLPSAVLCSTGAIVRVFGPRTSSRPTPEPSFAPDAGSMDIATRPAGSVEQKRGSQPSTSATPAPAFVPAAGSMRVIPRPAGSSATSESSTALNAGSVDIATRPAGSMAQKRGSQPSTKAIRGMILVPASSVRVVPLATTSVTPKSSVASAAGSCVHDFARPAKTTVVHQGFRQPSPSMTPEPCVSSSPGSTFQEEQSSASSIHPSTVSINPSVAGSDRVEEK
ncbi:endochitinase A-like [Anopheles stephensi]|uniref:endochitinase A-like n=1 Tax=Anopheles stephensi TaxID=30069 RepID=UPI0016587CA7|nr:endochitinase A-like [Anopheles stephensi]XP_035917873.1 endochitinase A-like [Anopheles stephensi]XP_035917889.1 endochitinase A-like [Anopheles stephensi]